MLKQLPFAKITHINMANVYIVHDTTAITADVLPYHQNVSAEI